MYLKRLAMHKFYLKNLAGIKEKVKLFTKDFKYAYKNKNSRLAAGIKVFHHHANKAKDCREILYLYNKMLKLSRKSEWDYFSERVLDFMVYNTFERFHRDELYPEIINKCIKYIDREHLVAPMSHLDKIYGLEHLEAAHEHTFF